MESIKRIPIFKVEWSDENVIVKNKDEIKLYWRLKGNWNWFEGQYNLSPVEDSIISSHIQMCKKQSNFIVSEKMCYERRWEQNTDCSAALGTSARTLWDCPAASSKHGKIYSQLITALMLYFQNPSRIFKKCPKIRSTRKNVRVYVNFYERWKS